MRFSGIRFVCILLCLLLPSVSLAVDGNGKDEVIIDFGSGVGLWERLNNTSWVFLHPLSPDSMTTGDMDGSGQDDVIIDFGTGVGVWRWMNNTSFAFLHPTSPDSITTTKRDLLALSSNSAIPGRRLTVTGSGFNPAAQL